MMLNSKLPTYMAWGPDLTSFYNDAYRPILGIKPEALGRSFKELWSEIWNDISPIVEQAFGGEASFFENLPSTLERKGYPEQTWWSFSYSPIRDESGGVGGVLCTVYETTAEVLTRRGLQAEKNRLQSLFQQAPGIMAMVSGPEHVFELANASYLELVGSRELIGKTAREALPEVEGQGFFELLDNVYSTGEPFIGREVPISIQRRQGAPPETRYVDFIYQPAMNDQGRVTGIFVEGHDVTERALAMRHQHLLINELNHRVKNTLATVHSIAAQSFRDIGKESGEKLKSFNDRLFALARAHDVLTRENWDGAELHEVIREVLQPYLRGASERFELDGPRLRLPPSMVLALAMALHELATNAAKYGALSASSGRILINWSTTNTNPSRFVLRWEECGGPPVKPPTREGFGTRLIERMLANDLSGKVQLTYEPTGVRCVVKAPLETEAHLSILPR